MAIPPWTDRLHDHWHVAQTTLWERNKQNNPSAHLLTNEEDFNLLHHRGDSFCHTRPHEPLKFWASLRWQQPYSSHLLLRVDAIRLRMPSMA